MSWYEHGDHGSERGCGLFYVITTMLLTVERFPSNERFKQCFCNFRYESICVQALKDVDLSYIKFAKSPYSNTPVSFTRWNEFRVIVFPRNKSFQIVFVLISCGLFELHGDPSCALMQ